METNIQIIKKSLTSFRLLELRKCMKFLRLPVRNDRKRLLQERIIEYIRKLDEKFVQGPVTMEILKLERQLKAIALKKNLKKQKRCATKFASGPESPFFQRTLNLMQPMKIRDTSTIILDIPKEVLKFFSGKQSKKPAFTYEIQLELSYSCPDCTVILKVNDKLVMEATNPDPIFYITPFCSFSPNEKNEVEIKLPFINQEIEVAAYFAKRITPSQLLQKAPVKEVMNIQQLVKKVFMEQGLFVYHVVLYCPFENKVIQNPCRSSYCCHPDVFDLWNFLDRMQYNLVWKCPICQKNVTYESLELESYFKIYLEKGKTTFNFYCRRKSENFIIRADSSSDKVVEVISLDVSKKSPDDIRNPSPVEEND